MAVRQQQLNRHRHLEGSNQAADDIPARRVSLISTAAKKPSGASPNFISYAGADKWQDDLENYKIMPSMHSDGNKQSGNAAKSEFATKLS
ncbi:MAG TPA: hypothetical protein V6D22_03110 [Candidatus Obscuribacterales bacterium]